MDDHQPRKYGFELLQIFQELSGACIRQGDHGTFQPQALTAGARAMSSTGRLSEASGMRGRKNDHRP